jgi:metallo-beta-lactamase family protein
MPPKIASLRLQFLGAAETVTGSRYLVETRSGRILVDCGLFQGYKRLRERNWEPFPVDPASIQAVVLTHAHLDHSGYLPRLCREGFRGKIYCTEGTRDLLEILLPDSGRLQEEQARHANAGAYSKHHPARPLYGEEEALQCLERLETVPFHADFSPCAGFTARFSRAGHILGSGSLRLEAVGRSILFSGDLGRASDPVMRPPDAPPRADILVVESTYGDRLHPDEDVPGALEALVRDTVEKRSVLMIPAFAVGRVQHLLHLLATLRAEGRIPEIPVFLNSPMGVSATEIFLRHPEDHKLTEEQCRALARGVTFTRTVEESKALEHREGPRIFIAGSGMATGGRILHHFARHLPDANAGVLFVGYQAPGTRGHSLVTGASEVKLQGRYVPVRARVSQIEGLSAHADYLEILAWMKSGPGVPPQVFVTHGDPAAADALRVRIRDAFGCRALVPKDGAVYEWPMRE